MLALSSVAVCYFIVPPVSRLISSHQLLCALHWVSQGRCSSQGNVVKFSTEEYADHFDNYQDSIISGLQHPSFGQQLRDRLQWLNTQGLWVCNSSMAVLTDICHDWREQMRLAGIASPCKLQPVVIPPTVAASINTTNADTRVYSPDTTPAIAACTSASRPYLSTSYFPAGMGTMSPGSSFSSTSLLGPSSLTAGPSYSYSYHDGSQYTNPFM